VTGTDTAKHLTANLSGAKFVRLVVTDAGNGNNSDHADWAAAQTTCS
jgi:alpha-galactosidase